MSPGRGGVRPGAGRPPGARNKPKPVAVAKPAGRLVFDFEQPGWSHEESRLRAERRHFTYALRYGPNDVNGLSDAELRSYFDEWGREQGELDPRTDAPTGVWPETSYAYQRYIKRLSVDAARAAMLEAEKVEWEELRLTHVGLSTWDERERRDGRAEAR